MHRSLPPSADEMHDVHIETSFMHLIVFHSKVFQSVNEINTWCPLPTDFWILKPPSLGDARVKPIHATSITYSLNTEYSLPKQQYPGTSSFIPPPSMHFWCLKIPRSKFNEWHLRINKTTSLLHSGCFLSSRAIGRRIERQRANDSGRRI